MRQEDTTTAASKRERELRRHAEKLLLTTFEARYGQELTAEEDVFRTLPFFATALGVVVAACAYAGNRLPPMPDLLQTVFGTTALAFLFLGVLCAVVVLICLLFATWSNRFYRPGSERELAKSLEEQVALFAVDPIADPENAADGLRQIIIKAYVKVTPYNQAINQARRRLRAVAAVGLIFSLLFALAATSIIFTVDKLGYLPRITP